MKLIIDIPAEKYIEIKKGINHFSLMAYAIRNGITLDDVTTEVFRQSKQTNEKFSNDWNDGFNVGMCHTLTIIREYFKHMSNRRDKVDESDN